MNALGRRRLRLRLRDLAAAAAFASVGLSGAVPTWVSALFVVACALGLFNIRPLANQRAWSVVMLLVIAVVLFGLAFRGLLDLVVAAVCFASLVTAHRMLSAPSSTTDRQVLLASLLLMAGGAALAGELWYGGCLLAFGTFACLTLGLSAVEGPSDLDEDVPIRSVLRQVGFGVVCALIGGIAFFFLFPRLSWNLAGRRASPGLGGATSGMSDRVRLGEGGTIKTSARAVLRARLEPDPGTQRLDRYWPGRYFDAFDGREWRGSGVAQPAATRVTLDWSDAYDGSDSRRLVQRIELLPAFGSRTLVAIDRPLAFDGAVGLSTVGATSLRLVEMKDEEVRFVAPANAYTYVAFSEQPRRVLRALSDEMRERTLALPKDLDARIKALAEQVARGETSARGIATRLERHLKESLSYSLDSPEGSADPLADFLFVRKEGHCEAFATALAVMLRLRGIPSRVVGGFYGGERLVDRYVVRAGDAHAWVEAFIPENGWVAFDATPDSARSGQPLALWADVVTFYERLEELWRARVVDYSFLDQVDAVRGWRRWIRPPRNFVGAEGDERRGNGLRLAPTTVGALLLFGVVAVLLARLAARHRAQKHHAATSFLLDIERRLARARVPRRLGEELEELSTRLARSSHAAAAPLSRATRRYLEARFGRRPLGSAERQALLRALDRGLGPSPRGQ